MEIINPGAEDRIPLLEHTSNETDRLLIYQIQQGDTDFNRFYLYKSNVKKDGALEPEVLLVCNDFQWLHSQILKQGFWPLAENPNDDPRIMRVYV